MERLAKSKALFVYWIYRNYSIRDGTVLGCLVIIGAILFGLFVIAMWVMAAYLLLVAFLMIGIVILGMAVAYFGGVLIAWLIERFNGKQVGYGDVLGSNVGGAIGVWVIILTVIFVICFLCWCLT